MSKQTTQTGTLAGLLWEQLEPLQKASYSLTLFFSRI
jgi:hypothetical protein